ncbi:hypothetical protein J2Z69_003629 [Paenibacillus shirakamiensis]|uniref:YtpI-like protein n=1 Tax=Paenibacillus shirakamiensis TaxID=1265935 RepID=A0ABS4JLG1_9BACL|nr:YtpI family protein [Paenibacillus shirakamiensis]MBP2002543.1 hypothetical protein [Paenibacillus shirakamiensis]
MIQSIEYVLYAALIIACVCSLFFSFKSRRSLDAHTRGVSGARMNVSMGAMLISLALIQMFIFSGSTLRVVIGALFLVLGAFNIFAGLRNLTLYSRQRP